MKGFGSVPCYFHKPADTHALSCISIRLEQGGCSSEPLPVQSLECTIDQLLPMARQISWSLMRAGLHVHARTTVGTNKQTYNFFPNQLLRNN